MKVAIAIAIVGVSAGLLVSPLQAVATTPERFTESEHVHEVIGTCGPEDDLVGDWTVTQTVTWFSSGTGSLHLQVVGTITRTGTGVAGKYSERQRDFIHLDGSERYVGLLGHLVVPGGGGFTLAGQAWLDTDGTLSNTPGLDPLLDLDVEAAVCAALVR
jgi:hypothetical protein